MQIQNAGTVAGNLCNASPAADGVPALLALRRRSNSHRPRAAATLPLERFVLGPRRTALAPGELVTAMLGAAAHRRARGRRSSSSARGATW